MAGLTSAARAQISAAPAASRDHAWKVVTETARYNLKTINSVRDQLTAASSDFAARAGNNLTVWYSDPLTDSVRVGVSKVTPELRRAAEAEFGDKVTLFQEARHHSMDKLTRINRAPSFQRVATGSKNGQAAARSTAATATRLLDSAPYAGGDRIVSQQVINGGNYIVQCTVNFDFTMNSGSPSMGTAGHCGATGISWQQGYYDGSAKTIHYTGTMGKTYTRQWGNNRTDAELLNDTGNSHGFWTQVYIDNTTLSDVGSVDPASVGERSCSDGSFTGQNCSGTISAADVCENINDDGTIFKVCNLDIAKSGTRLVQSGDSGGPVYLANGHTVHPQGVISAGSTNGLELDFSDMGFVDITMGGYPEPTH
ncbi:S1 family peptidase [Streptomyces sp. MUSC 14]|uniref:S1 family peptidase n=1 Tax=Streptomyces sp. MUSC 14 TaxID=1354889 RepID=UPI0015A55B7C|nr:S1 family peptidase [Streptomyces sp. MUSC 14]